MANENNVLTIKDGVVTACDKNVVNVVIPDGVREIDWEAFIGCKSLSSVVIPATMTEIVVRAFSDCDSLTSVEFCGSIAQWEAVKGKRWLLEDAPAKTVKCTDGEWQKPVVLVENGVAVVCLDKSATSVTIPEGVTQIGKSAFSDCKSLLSVVIPEGVTEIGWHAFDDCKSLKSIVIPSTVTEIGWYAFKGCNDVENVVSASASYPFNEKTGKLYDATGERKKVLLTLAKTVAKKAKIEKVQNASASAVLDSIVSASKADTKIIRSEKDAYLRISAGESGIEILLKDAKVSKWMKTLPALLSFAETGADASALRKYIADNGFEDTSKKYLRVSTDGSVSWKKNTEPVYLVIPEGVTELKMQMFLVWEWDDDEFKYVVTGGCPSLKSIVLPASVTKIGKRAFEECESLKEFVFAGTMQQWEAVEKGKNWDYGAGFDSVVCSDGKISLLF